MITQLLHATPDTVTPEWLTEILRNNRRDRGARVSSVSYAPIGEGLMGDSIRFSLTYDRDEGGPASVVAKVAPTPPNSRSTGVDLGFYRNEVRFYQEIAPTVAINTPHCYFAEIDANGDFMILLEDAAPARQGNQIEGCSIDDARHAMVQAAALHGPRWNDPALKQIDWLRERTGVLEIVCNALPDALAAFHRRFDGVLEPEYMAVCDQFGKVARQFYTLDYQPWSLMHVDFRLDNMLFDAQGGAVPLTVIDWQSIAVGTGALDVSYFLGGNISIEERRLHERSLLKTYHEELRLHGVKDYTFDQLWHDYRLNTLQGVGTAIFTTASVKQTERGDRMLMSMARGACAQVIDLETCKEYGL